MSEDFTCENCGRTMPKAWSDEEAAAESRDLFGEVPAEDLVVVCDNCYRRMMAHIS